ncbi:MAG: hypothetical protein H0U46_05595 [Actinobacteria bacterium]|nr:hypothetical protein [Actinomycetota bacterium]
MPADTTAAHAVPPDEAAAILDLTDRVATLERAVAQLVEASGMRPAPVADDLAAIEASLTDRDTKAASVAMLDLGVSVGDRVVVHLDMGGEYVAEVTGVADAHVEVASARTGTMMVAAERVVRCPRWWGTR